jgi:hypothetical protein
MMRLSPTMTPTTMPTILPTELPPLCGGIPELAAGGRAVLDVAALDVF